MKSIFQKQSGSGTFKVYESGIVGYQPKTQSHDEYARAMKSLKKVTPQNGDILLTKYFKK